MMPKIGIAVGSLRRPKLNAVWEAISVLGPTLDPNAQFEVEAIDVPSGVQPTPLSRAETMAGAKARVETLAKLAVERQASWRYLVGLEGGLDAFEENGARRVFLENWAYVADRSGRTAWGHSGGILLPQGLAERVCDRGEDLGAAIDDFAGSSGIRDAQGAWGVLSRNLITRQDSYRVAVIAAFAPFFNGEIYGRS